MESKSGEITQKLFRPAISILNRLNYTRKFTVLWLVSLIAIAVVVYSLYINLDRIIQPARQRLEGLALIEPISRFTQALQLHRGLSATLLGGNESVRSSRAAQEEKVANALKTLEEKLPPGLIATEDYRHIRTEWARLQKEGLKWTLAANLDTHTHLIEHIQYFEQLVADEHLLTMDMDIALYYLNDITTKRLTYVLEHLGRLRAYGTGALARKHLTEDQRVELKVMLAELEEKFKYFNLGISSVSRHNPAIHGALQAVSRDIDNSVRLVSSRVTADILSGRFATKPEAFLNLATEQIDQSYAQLHDSLLPMAKRLTQAHIDRAKQELIATVGISMLAFLLMVYLSVSIYYAIISNIQTIARSARSFAKGNLRERIKVHTRDELSQVCDSFNEMADGFNAMLTAHREDEMRLRATFETAMDAMVQIDDHSIITGWNQQAENIFGWTQQEAVGRKLSETIIPPQYREAHAQGLKRFLLTGEGPILNLRNELVGLHRDGHELPVELTVAPIKLAGQYEFSAFIRDITRKKESDDLIWKQANFDTLTSLPNRHMFHDRLAQEIKKADRDNLKIALLFIDLDKFKEVNDTLGHSIGDIMLVEAARRIGECVRETDTVARLGGDEFTVILSELDDGSNVGRVAENILRKLIEPFHLGNEVTYVSASIGITLYPDDATEIEHLLKNADQAMYAAKDKGRNRFDYFTPSMQQIAQTRLKMINELRGALAAGQFRVYYQPIVELATGRIHKAEALIRWQHPELGLVSPAQFIPLAEETGLIVGIGDWVFRESARQVKRLRTLHKPDFQISVNMSAFQISVNMSPIQFHSADSPHKTWFVYLRELDLPGQSINIEITEGLLLDAGPAVTDKLLEFRDAGIQVAIDDFGTGYSSLAYLKRLSIDYLKIDQSFVQNLASDPDDMALSEAIIVMAHKLGLKVIAEGVETEEQRRLLADAGCDYAQGYLFSRPVPAEEFEKFLEDRGTA